jgi:hypothetical protein
MAGCRLVTMLDVSGVSRPGRVGHSDPQRPSNGSIWRPISRTTGGVGFCPLDRAVGVNPRFSLRYTIRLVVFVPQHQMAMYETYKEKSSYYLTARYVVRDDDQLNAKCAIYPYTTAAARQQLRGRPQP